jgi:hypothetical protein
MMELLVDLGVLVLVLVLLVGWLAVWRIGHVVSWQALARTAWATRSFAQCVAFIRFCVEERDLMTENRPGGQHGDQPRVRAGHVLDELRRVS